MAKYGGENENRNKIWRKYGMAMKMGVINEKYENK